ncbi:PrsW family intramembrane metalloprotease [Leifsonia sp. NPDC058230]|uniref:PrsW family intramembrane metalloprotease n=1 Tax=Leifsonia sp. NPDC058230 TaxID=3346391 RepID=UPI0036DABA27
MNERLGGRHHHHGWWWKSLLIGLALWIITIVTTFVTLNTNLVPTLILLGSFLVPFCVVLFVVERVTGNVSVLQLLVAFIIGGIFGVLGASLLEANLEPAPWLYVAVGLIEEFVKGVILVVVGWRVVPKTATQGALLGATIGAGFAAFESAGYAFNAALTAQGIDLISLLQTEVIRAIATPVGHVLWTAILGAVIFGAAKGRERYRWSWWIPLAFVGVSLLHALWDSMSGIASVLAVLVTGGALEELKSGFLTTSTARTLEALTTTFYVTGLVLASAIGVLTLWLVLRHYRRLQEPVATGGAATVRR